MGLNEEVQDKYLKKLMDSMEQDIGSSIPIPKFDTVEEFVEFINSLLEELK